MKDLTVVIPCLNEVQTIATCIEKCKEAFKLLNINGEIIVSDNGSKDESAAVAASAGAKVVICNNIGYGNALRAAFEKCDSRWILIGDADNTYDFLEIPLLWNSITFDSDMIMGTRLKGKIDKNAMPFLNRYLGTPVLTFILNLLYGTKISDCNCGMRLMKKDCIDKIDFKTTGMEFASELLVEFAKHNFIIKEVPISLHKGKDGRKPHLRPWQDGFRHLKYLIEQKVI